MAHPAGVLPAHSPNLNLIEWLRWFLRNTFEAAIDGILRKLGLYRRSFASLITDRVRLLAWRRARFLRKSGVSEDERAQASLAAHHRKPRLAVADGTSPKRRRYAAMNRPGLVKP